MFDCDCFSAFPAPIVFGLVIDSACLVQQGGCTKGERTGACLYYDNHDFRWKLHGFTFTVKTVAAFIYLLALYFSKNVKYYDGTEDDEKVDTEVKNIGHELMAVTKEPLSEGSQKVTVNNVSSM